MVAARSRGLPADWSWRRKVSLIVFALMMTYLHSLYILRFYVSELEYWWPFWTGMTVEQRLFSYALALFANFALMAMPFLRTWGLRMRVLLVISLSCGIAISIAWLARNLIIMGFFPLWPRGSLSSGLITLLLVRVAAYGVYGTAIYVYSKLLLSLRSPH
jgi:hypothetical protein